MYFKMAETSKVILVTLLLILAHGSSRVSCVMMENLYPFGEAAGDTEFDTDNSVEAILSLSDNVVFLGQSMGSIFINPFGALSFLSFVNDPNTIPDFPSLVGPPTIAPYWASGVDLDLNNPNNPGRVFFRVTRDPTLLMRATADIWSRFGDQMSVFQPTSVIIVTWYRLQEFMGGPEQNTFQCVIATNGLRSFIEFLYPMGGINWGAEAQIGINAGMIGIPIAPFNSAQVFVHPDARTSESVNVETTTNSMMPGIWTFRLDTFALLEPGELPVAVDIQLVELLITGVPVNLQVTEGQGIFVDIPALFLSVDNTESVTLQITLFTTDGAAVGGEDYITAVDTSEITLSASDQPIFTQSLFVQTLEDSMFEGAEDLIVTFNTSVPVVNVLRDATVVIIGETGLGLGSGSGSGSSVGSGFFGGCVDAGFFGGCCDFGNCQAPAGCFCDQICHSFGDCCPDILEIECFDDTGSTPTPTPTPTGPTVDLNGLPFGVDAGDSQLPNFFISDSGPINMPFKFFGEMETTIFVNSFGCLTFRDTDFFFPEPFDGPFSPEFPIIAPFWTIIDIGFFGDVFYRETNEPALLQQFTDLIGQFFPDFNFQPNDLFIATWYRVADVFFFPVEDTFQAVLATDGDISIICFVYGSVGGTFANVGFSSGSRSFMFPGALNDVADIEFGSNVGEPGLYIYRVDLPVILELNDSSIFAFFDETNYTVDATESSVEVCVNVQNNEQNTPITITIFTISIGSATEGEDYEPLPPTDLTFTEVDSQQCVNITILNDDPGVLGPIETFEVNFLLTSGDAFVFDSMATVTILDNDIITESFFPFGEEAGDELLDSGAFQSSPPIFFYCPFPFYGSQETFVIVNSNGVLSFRDNFTNPFPEPFDFQPPGNALIAPFWNFIDTGRFGNIWYRYTLDPDCLARAAEMIRDLVPNAVPGFEPKYLFIATWERVAQSFGGNEENTFQVVLATDGVVSYVCFVYGAIEWGPFSNIGFRGGQNNPGPGRSFMLPGALTFSTIDIEFTSNVDVQGLYIYRVDLPLIIELDDPLIYAGLSDFFREINESSILLDVCVFAVSNAPIDPPLSFPIEPSFFFFFPGIAQFGVDYEPFFEFVTFNTSRMECFNLTVINDNIVEFDEFFQLQLFNIDFRPDVIVLNRFLDIIILDDEVVEIQFDAEVYEVGEYIGDNNLALLVCIQPTLGNLTFERSVGIEVSTESGTAVGSQDFVDTSSVLTFGPFSNSSQLCLCIQILQDIIVEGHEVFFVNVRQDDNIGVTQNVSVYINDDEVLEISLEQESYEVVESGGIIEVCAVVVGDPVLGGSFRILLSTEDSTAISGPGGGMDYVVIVEGEFDQNNRRQCIIIEIIDDSVMESDEVFFVLLETLPDETNVIISPGGDRSSVTILDDDDETFGLECVQSSISPSGPVDIACLPRNGEIESLECDYNSGLTDEPCGLIIIVDFTQFEPGSLTLIITATSTEGETASATFEFNVPEPLLLECTVSSGVPGSVTISCTTSRDLFQPPFCELEGIGVIEPCDLDNIELSLDDLPPGTYTLTITVVDVLEQTATEIIQVFLSDSELGLPFTLINNSPRVSDNNLDAEFTINIPLQDVRCEIENIRSNSNPQILESQDCSSGSVSFTTILRRRQRLNFFIRGTRPGANDVTDELVREFRVENGACSVHLVNEGIIVNGGSVMVQWQGTGPSDNNRVDEFICRIIQVDQTTQMCTSPYTRSGLAPGAYTLTIRPAPDQDCDIRYTRFFEFEITT